MLRIAGWIAGGLIALVLLTVAAGLGYRAWRQHEVAKAIAITTPNGIDEGMFVKVGGIDQWITIRGEDRSNPVILNLHGGPGSAFPPGGPMRPWERDFTVVQWDQRGAGRTYMRNPRPAGGLTIDRMTQDGLEVADLVRKRLHKSKIVLMGGSWGTILGLQMVKARPDLFSAYVGGGNVIDPPRMDGVARESLLEQARAKGDGKSVKALEDIGPPPWPVDKMNVERKILFGYAPPAERAINVSFVGILLSAPGYSLRDVYLHVRGMWASATALVPQIEAWKAQRLGRDFEVPMFFFQGTEDLQTPTAVVRDYEGWINAPHKELVLLPGGGHTAMLAFPDLVLKELDARVRPLAIAADAAPASPAPRTPPAPPRAH